MDVNRIVTELDTEISRLQQVRAALAGVNTGASDKPKRGRPKGSGTKAATSSLKSPAKKRQMSPEGRKAIADAMKRRWAERKKAKG